MEYKNNSLIINSDDGVATIPILQIKSLIINSLKTRITTYLINALIDNNVKMIICNNKKNPTSEIVPYCSNIFAPAKLNEQINWTDIEKDLMWQKIVISKITNQQMLLEKLNIKVPFQLYDYIDTVDLSDYNNREALAAKLYFRSLFGEKFVRHTESNINSALNYGYTILQSLISRIITERGFNTSIGIKHHSATNQFNLSCDLMEPFRPCIDRIVFLHGDDEFNSIYKKELIAFSYNKIRYRNKTYDVSTAIDVYVSEVLKNINNDTYIIGEFDLL